MPGDLLAGRGAVVSLDLETLEGYVWRGLHHFLDAGRALRLIRDRQLYRPAFPTWERYCEGRWGFTDRRARQLISAAELVDRLQVGSEIGTRVPVTEKGSRQLARLPEGLQRLAWAALLGREGAAGEADVEALVAAILAGLSPEQQAAILAADAERALPKEPAAARPVNWPRRLTNAERTLEALAKVRPDLAERYADRLRLAVEVLEELARELAG